MAKSVRMVPPARRRIQSVHGAELADLMEKVVRRAKAVAEKTAGRK